MTTTQVREFGDVREITGRPVEGYVQRMDGWSVEVEGSIRYEWDRGERGSLVR